VVVHSLPAGYGFDLEQRVLVPVAEPVSRVRPRGPASRRLERMSRAVAAEGADSFAVERRQSQREASE